MGGRYKSINRFQSPAINSSSYFIPNTPSVRPSVRSGKRFRIASVAEPLEPGSARKGTKRAMERIEERREEKEVSPEILAQPEGNPFSPAPCTPAMRPAMRTRGYGGSASFQCTPSLLMSLDRAPPVGNVDVMR